jgi:hypothetical protein
MHVAYILWAMVEFSADVLQDRQCGAKICCSFLDYPRGPDGSIIIYPLEELRFKGKKKAWIA